MVRETCEVQLKDRNAKDLVLMLSLKETTDQMAIANRVR